MSPPRLESDFLVTFSEITCLLLILTTGLGMMTPLRAQTGKKGAATMAFTLHSTDFANGGDIPRAFTCDGEDRSPALAWNDAPTGTRTFALIADDPDAPVGTWVHWVIFNVPGNAKGLAGSVSKNEQLADGTRQGRNDFRRIGYNGPCPPPGKPHRYFFKLYALSTDLSLAAGPTKADLERAMEGHILGQAEWMGRYKR